MATRNEISSFIEHWNHLSELSVSQLTSWLGLQRGRYYEWLKRQAKPNEHNAKIPKSHWLLDSEREAIIEYSRTHLKAGYRRMAHLMLDADVVAVSPSSVYRVLEHAGLIQKWTRRSSKGQGFDQPTEPHQHWHIDFSYIRIKDIFYFLSTVLDGYSRAVLSWDLKPTMTQTDAQIVVQKARERFPGVKPRIISDNGPQFIGGDFKSFINICDMTHVTTAPYYPQSNGKLERYHRSIKTEGLRPNCPLNQQDAQQIISRYIHDYNHKRLHSAIGYVPPMLRLEGKDRALHEQRKQKLQQAAIRRKVATRENNNTSSHKNPFSLKKENVTNLATI